MTEVKELEACDCKFVKDTPSVQVGTLIIPNSILSADFRNQYLKVQVCLDHGRILTKETQVNRVFQDDILKYILQLKTTPHVKWDKKWDYIDYAQINDDPLDHYH
jgi:hypothetical protein